MCTRKQILQARNLYLASSATGGSSVKTALEYFRIFRHGFLVGKDEVFLPKSKHKPKQNADKKQAAEKDVRITRVTQERFVVAIMDENEPFGYIKVMETV